MSPWADRLPGRRLVVMAALAVCVLFWVSRRSGLRFGRRADGSNRAAAEKRPEPLAGALAQGDGGVAPKNVPETAPCGTDQQIVSYQLRGRVRNETKDKTVQITAVLMPDDAAGITEFSVTLEVGEDWKPFAVPCEGQGRLFLFGRVGGRRVRLGEATGYAASGKDVYVGDVCIPAYSVWLRVISDDQEPLRAVRVLVSYDAEGPWQTCVSNERGDVWVEGFSAKYVYVRIPPSSELLGAEAKRYECFPRPTEPITVRVPRVPMVLFEGKARSELVLRGPVSVAYRRLSDGAKATLWGPTGYVRLVPGQYEFRVRFGIGGVALPSAQFVARISAAGDQRLTVPLIVPPDRGMLRIDLSRFGERGGGVVLLTRLVGGTTGSAREVPLGPTVPVQEGELTLVLPDGGYGIRCGAVSEKGVFLAAPVFVSLKAEEQAEVSPEPRQGAALVIRQAAGAASSSSTTVNRLVSVRFFEGAERCFALWAPAFPSTFNASFMREANIPGWNVRSSALQYWLPPDEYTLKGRYGDGRVISKQVRLRAGELATVVFPRIESTGGDARRGK